MPDLPLRTVHVPESAHVRRTLLLALHKRCVLVRFWVTMRPAPRARVPPRRELMFLTVAYGDAGEDGVRRLPV